MAELDALDPVPETVKLVSGNSYQLEDLRSRQFFALLRIVTRGAAPAISQGLFRMDPTTDARDFGMRLAATLFTAIPEASEETLEFVRTMLKPVGLIEGRKLNKQDGERNAELWLNLELELENPELDDLITVIEAVVKRESTNLVALGKRLAAMFKLAEKTGQLNPRSSTPATTEIFSEASPEPLISYPTSTDGPTTQSGLSHSGAYVSVSSSSENDGTTSPGTGSN